MGSRKHTRNCDLGQKEERIRRVVLAPERRERCEGMHEQLWAPDSGNSCGLRQDRKSKQRGHELLAWIGSWSLSLGFSLST